MYKNFKNYWDLLSIDIRRRRGRKNVMMGGDYLTKYYIKTHD